jgi:hypothetical protein
MALPAAVELDRVGVAADKLARLVQGDLVVGMEEVTGDEPRHAGPYDRDLHRPLPTRPNDDWMNPPPLQP